MKKGKEHRACISRAKASCIINLASMMLDFGTAAHIFNKVEKFTDWKRCDVRVSLGDNSEIKATRTDIRKVTWSIQKTDADV